jgi:WD40 repeat protein
VHTLKHKGWVFGAVFTSDKGRILTWSGDGTARLWATPEEVIDFDLDERLLDFEIRSTAVLPKSAEFQQVLTFDKWTAKKKEWEDMQKRRQK